MMNNFVELVDAHGRTMPKGGPPVLVAHPNYGSLGSCVAGKGFVPERGRWASTRAILRDSDRATVMMLRKFEDHAPRLLIGAVAALIAREPMSTGVVLGAISTYDGIVSARGSGAMQDVWMSSTAAIGGVTLMWYSLFNAAWTPGAAPSMTAYTNAGTGGAVFGATNIGSWLVNPGGSNKKYVVSLGVTTPSITGFSIGILMDFLWGGQYAITANATINPSSDIAVTRYSGTASAGNRMMCYLNGTLTHTVAGTITTTYTDQAGGTGKTTASITPATGPLVNRVIFNTLHNSATVVASSPFMPMTNAGSYGVRNLEQVAISGGTISSGTVNHFIVRPLIIMPFIAANSYIEQDTTLNIGNMVELVNVSQVCGALSWANFTAGTTATTMSSMLRTVEG